MWIRQRRHSIHPFRREESCLPDQKISGLLPYLNQQKYPGSIRGVGFGSTEPKEESLPILQTSTSVAGDPQGYAFPTN